MSLEGESKPRLFRRGLYYSNFNKYDSSSNFKLFTCKILKQITDTNGMKAFGIADFDYVLLIRGYLLLASHKHYFL